MERLPLRLSLNEDLMNKSIMRSFFPRCLYKSFNSKKYFAFQKNKVISFITFSSTMCSIGTLCDKSQVKSQKLFFEL